MAGKTVSPAGDRPEWLPEDWTMKIKKRGFNSKKIDRPSVELESCEVKQTIARRHIFAREEPSSDAITGGDSTQEPALSFLTHASAQLHNGASETSSSTSKNIEQVDQMVCESQLECEPHPMKVVVESGNEKSSEPMVHAEGEIQVPGSNLLEEAQFELTKKRSQPQRQKRRDSSNTEAVGSVNNVRKRSVAKGKSIPTCTSKQLSGVTAEPISNFGTGNESKSPKTAPIEPIVPEEAPETDELEEKLVVTEPFVEQDSQELKNPLPLGDSWSDPCIEFAFKTLTSDFPVLKDIAAIQDYYFNHQSPNPGVGPSSSLLGGPSSLYLQNIEDESSNPTWKKTM